MATDVETKPRYRMLPGYRMRLRVSPSVDASLTGSVIESGECFDVVERIIDNEQVYLKTSKPEGWAFLFHPQKGNCLAEVVGEEAQRSRRRSRRESRRLSMPTVPEPILFDLPGFEFLELIGEGGFSEVYEAIDQAGSHVAVKVVDKKKLRPHDEVSLLSEVAILSRLRHPGVLHFIQHSSNDDYHFLVCALFRGGDLFDRIIECGCYPEDEACSVIRQLMTVLAFLHVSENSLVHRDIKPENLLLQSEEDRITITLADFGFAASVEELKSPEAREFRFGTVDYMAPELLSPGEPDYTTAGDIWAAGVVAYVLLAGRQPFEQENESRSSCHSKNLRCGDEDYPIETDVEDSSPDREGTITQRIKRADFNFNGTEWSDISMDAQNFIKNALTIDYRRRPSAAELLEHRWFDRHEAAVARGAWEVASDANLFTPGKDSYAKKSGTLEFFIFDRGKPIGLNFETNSLVVESITPLTQAHEQDVSIGMKVVEVNSRTCTTVEEFIRYRALDGESIRITLERQDLQASAQNPRKSSFNDHNSIPNISVDYTKEGQDSDKAETLPEEHPDDKSNAQNIDGRRSISDSTASTISNEATHKAAYIKLEVARVLALVNDLVKQADDIMASTPSRSSGSDATNRAILLYQDAIDAVLGLRSMAPELFVEDSELMKLAEQLLQHAESLPGACRSRSPQSQESDEDEDPQLEADDVTFELQKFYDLHTIPESESFRDNSDLEEEEEDEKEEEQADDRVSRQADLGKGRSNSRESHEVQDPDAPGSARGSFDSDDYAILLGLPASPLKAANNSEAKPKSSPRRKSVEVSLGDVFYGDNKVPQQPKKDNFHPSLNSMRSKGGRGLSILNRGDHGRGGRWRGGRKMIHDSADFAPDHGASSPLLADATPLEPRIEILNVAEAHEAVDSVVVLQPTEAEKKLAELQQLILLSHEAAVTGNGDADQMMRNLAAVSLGHRRSSTVVEETCGFMSSKDKIGNVPDANIDNKYSAATLAQTKISSTAATEEHEQLVQIDVNLSASVKAEHLRALRSTQEDYNRQMIAMNATKAKLDAIKYATKDVADRIGNNSTIPSPSLHMSPSLTTRIFPTVEDSEEVRQEAIVVTEELNDANTGMLVAEVDRKRSSGLPGNSGKEEQIFVNIVVRGADRAAFQTSCSFGSTIEEVLNEGRSSVGCCIEGLSINDFECMHLPFKKEALLLSSTLREIWEKSEHGPTSTAAAEWEVFENHDAFPGDNAMSRPFTSAEEAVRLCTSRCFGGFVVYQQTVYFRRQKQKELFEKKRRQKGSILYIAPNTYSKKQRSKKNWKNRPESSLKMTLIASLTEVIQKTLYTEMVKKKKPLRISIPTKCLRGADKFIERGESLKGKPKEKTPCKVLVTWWWRAEGDVGFSGLYQPMNSGFAAGRVAVPQKIVAAYSQGKSGQGEWEAPGDGNITFEFESNGAKGKMVHCGIAVH